MFVVSLRPCGHPCKLLLGKTVLEKCCFGSKGLVETVTMVVDGFFIRAELVY